MEKEARERKRQQHGGSQIQYFGSQISTLSEMPPVYYNGAKVTESYHGTSNNGTTYGSQANIIHVIPNSD